MNSAPNSFKIDGFASLPECLKQSDYIDLLLFLMHEKPSVRLGKNDAFSYNQMKKWCRKNKFRYVISNDGYMYISKYYTIAKIVQLVDDSSYNHSYILGLLLGYPKCCRKAIMKIGELNIDKYESILCKKKFIGDYRLIDPSLYTKGCALISHVPCSTHCKESLIIAKKAFHIINYYHHYQCMERWNVFMKSEWT